MIIRLQFQKSQNSWNTKTRLKISPLYTHLSFYVSCSFTQSLSLSLSLSLILCLYISVVFLSLSVYIFSLSIFASLSLFSDFFFQSLCLSLHVSLCISLSFSVYPSLFSGNVGATYVYNLMAFANKIKLKQKKLL